MINNTILYLFQDLLSEAGPAYFYLKCPKCDHIPKWIQTTTYFYKCCCELSAGNVRCSCGEYYKRDRNRYIYDNLSRLVDNI